MAITAETRQDIMELAVAANNAAPGTTLLSTLVAMSESGSSLLDIANELANSASFKATYPTFQTATEFATEFLGNLVPEAGADAVAEGVAIIEGMLNGGATRGDIILEAASYLAAADESDAAFGSSAALFNNRVEVAVAHTITNEDADSWDIPASVTSDDDSVATGTAEIPSVKAAADAAAAKAAEEKAAADAAAKAAADAAAAKAAEEKAAADAAAAAKAAEEKAAADAAAAEKALADASASAAASAAEAIEAAEEADAAVVAAQTASDEAAATAAETDAEALAAALEAATTADTDAKAAVVTAQAAYDAALLAGVAVDVSTANGELLIAQNNASLAAAALVEATTASEEATAADEAAAAAATALTEAQEAATAAADAADAAAAAAVTAAAATADTDDDEAAAAQVVAAAAADPVGDAAAEAAAEEKAAADAAAAKAAEDKAAADKAAADKAAADKAAADAAAAADALKQKFAFTTAGENETLGAYDDTATAALVGAGGAGSTAQPGDTLDGGAGSDKLTLSVSGDSGGDYTLQALILDSVETLHVNNFETDAGNNGPNTVTTIDGSLMTGLEEVGLAASSAEGDTKFDNVMNIVDIAMQNGSGDLQVAYATGVTTGTQTQNIALSNVSAGTLSVGGVENLNISSGIVKSTLTALTAAQMKSITVTGSTDLKITGALDFANDATGVTGAIDGTIDASAFTGKLTVTSAADEVSITGGSGNDTINMVATLNGYDKIDGGDGTDTLTMNAAALTTQFAQTSNIENVTFNESNADTTVDMSKLPAGVEKFTADMADAADSGAKVALTVTKADGTLINVVRSSADTGADGGNDDGVTMAVTNTVDTTDDTLNLMLTDIGLQSDLGGLDSLDASTYETINITADKVSAALGGDGKNEIVALTATVAKTVTVDGSGAFNTALTGTKVTTFDASGLAGALSLTAGTEKATYSMGGKSSTIAFGGNLNASDTVIGGAGTADIVTATVTGLSATTGALNVSDVEYVLLTTSGNNTIDLSGTSSLSNLAVTDNKQTITGIDLATTTVHLGLAGDESATSSEIDVTAADATGTDDTLSVIVNATAGAPSSIIDASDIENLSLTVGRSTTGTNNTTTLNMTTFEGSKITVGTAALAAGATVTAGTVDLGTLHKDTTTLISTNKAAVTASMTNATSVVTFEGLGTGIQTITGGLRGDTFTIGSTGAIAHSITGGAGTDTTNLTAATGLTNVGSIDTENVNITVPASVDVTIGTDFNAGVDAITITGGNSLSTFDAGTIDTAIKSIDASGFLGNLKADFAANVFDGTVKVTAGDLTTDEITAILTADGTYNVASAGVETLNLDTNGDVTANLSGTTGVKVVEVDLSTAAKTAKVSNVESQTIALRGSANANNVLEAIPVDSTETDNAISFELHDESTITADTKLKTTDVETVNITSVTAESIDLSLLTMSSATKTVTLNLYTSTTFAGITLSATSAQTTTINAAGAYGVTQNARSATTAVDYTGSAGDDTFIMMHAADKIAGGSGKGDKLDVDYGAVLGGISVDLSASGQQISTFDGGAISGSITGFEDVDLSGYTGGFGASVTAIKTGSEIIGTGAIDRITGGAGGDTITGGGGNDVISTGAGADKVVFSATNALNGADSISDFSLAADAIDIAVTLADLRGTGAVAQRAASGDALNANAGLVISSSDIADAAAAETYAEGLTGEGAGDITYLLGSTDADSAAGITTLYRVVYAGAGDAAITTLGSFNAFELDELAAANLTDYSAIV